MQEKKMDKGNNLLFLGVQDTFWVAFYPISLQAILEQQKIVSMHFGHKPEARDGALTVPLISSVLQSPFKMLLEHTRKV